MPARLSVTVSSETACPNFYRTSATMCNTTTYIARESSCSNTTLATVGSSNWPTHGTKLLEVVTFFDRSSKYLCRPKYLLGCVLDNRPRRSFPAPVCAHVRTAQSELPVSFRDTSVPFFFRSRLFCKNRLRCHVRETFHFLTPITASANSL